MLQVPITMDELKPAYFPKALAKMGPVRIRAFCFSVYDGDTIWCLGAYSRRAREVVPVRIIGYDTPELDDRDSVKKAQAFEARNDLASVILGKHVILENETWAESAGRMVAKVHAENAGVTFDVSDWMKANSKYAYEWSRSRAETFGVQL